MARTREGHGSCWKKRKKRCVTLNLHLQSFSCFFSFSHIVSSFFLTFSLIFCFQNLSLFFLELCALLPLLLTFNLTFEQLAVSHFPSLIHASHIYIFFSIHISTCIQCIMKLLGHDTHIMGLNIVGMWA